MEDSGGLMAAAIAFYGLLSLVPLLSLGIWILALFLGSSAEALPRMQESLKEILPGSGGLIYETLLAIKRDSGLAGLIGIGGLILSASAIFTNMELAFNNMWRVEKMRPWWRQRLVALGTTAVALSLMVVSIGITSAMTWVQNQRIPGLDLTAGEIPFVWRLLGNLLPLAFTILAFAVVYKIVPNCEISWRSSLLGALFAGILWEAAKYVFAHYAANYANFGKVYGSLGVVVSLMFWSYYTACILFLGGEIAAGRGTHAPEADPPPPNPVPRPVREGEPEETSTRQGYHSRAADRGHCDRRD
jgi:membrane protein